MVTKETRNRLRWHAGLKDHGVEDVPSVASTTWRGDYSPVEFERAFADYLDTMEALNHELNGQTPSSQSSTHAMAVPRDTAYAIAEVIRMLREHGGIPDRAAWRAETAWLAVLSGDIDDIRQLLRDEEAMRFG